MWIVFVATRFLKDAASRPCQGLRLHDDLGATQGLGGSMAPRPRAGFAEELEELGLMFNQRILDVIQTAQRRAVTLPSIAPGFALAEAYPVGLSP